jgi:hypothetical protein
VGDRVGMLGELLAGATDSHVEIGGDGGEADRLYTTVRNFEASVVGDRSPKSAVVTASVEK